MPRELRSLVPVEVAVVLAAAFIPLPVPAVVPLLIVASVSRWLRGHSWGSVVHGPATYAAIGLAAGLVGLVLALAVATPLVESISDYAVQWSMYPVARGSVGTAIMVAIVVAISAVAAELVLRGWLVERVLELSPGSPVLPVLVGAFAEALIVPGDLATRIGAGLFGIGLGWMYVSAGRTAMPGILARVAFQCGAVALEGLRLVG